MSISNLLKIYATKKFTPLQLNYLNNDKMIINRNTLFNQSKFLHEEISIRLSHRVFDLLKLPYGLPLLKPIKNVIDLYCESFEKIQSFKISNYNDVEKLNKIFINIKSNHNYLEDEISKGLYILKKNIDNNLINYNLINKELDKFFLSRISIRTLITQNNEILNGESLIKDCDLKKIIDHSVDNVSNICNDIYGFEPEIDIKNNDKIIFSYLPSHIFYVLNEVLKNSCVALNNDLIDNGKIKIDFSEGEKDIIIKISDNANSFKIEDLDKIMTYSYSSNPVNINENYNLSNKPVISGFGFGLPTARLYAKYFGGNLLVNPMENRGTDVFIYINKLGNNPESSI